MKPTIPDFSLGMNVWSAQRVGGAVKAIPDIDLISLIRILRYLAIAYQTIYGASGNSKKIYPVDMEIFEDKSSEMKNLYE